MKSDKTVEQGDVMTCRGLGKCVVAEVGGLSKKGRVILTLERYL
jgi:RNA-binding protein YlmH